MIITLIGMSGIGKSYWSERLEHKGFRRFCCDDIIEEKLGKLLKSRGYNGLHDVARWMGMPYDPQYPRTSTDYLNHETECMQEILRYLLSPTRKPEHIVIDTTGSVIYIDQLILKELKRHTTFVYLESPESRKETLYKRFIKDPKPIIWGTLFHQKLHEQNVQALKRCYRQLLDYRQNKYRELSDVILASKIHTAHNQSVSDFLQFIPQPHEMDKHEKKSNDALSGCSFL